MHDIMFAFREGGGFMYIVLAASVLHAIPTIAQLALVKKADLTPYLWGGLAGIGLLGLLGVLLGLYESLRAMGSASPEQQAAVLARGIAISLNVSALTAFLLLPGLLFAGIATCLTRNLTPVRPKI
jgi:hypothetical protein